jgi:hypothetical protein
MADKKSSKDIPPPLDPFPTYQVPYPRPSSSEPDENPFIAFRRFADSQISSLFSSVAGLPSIFAQSPASGRFADLEAEMNRRRQELEEGWRKQWEQEREEGKQEWEKAKNGIGQWTSSSSDSRRNPSDIPARPQEPTNMNDFMSGIVKMIEDIEKPLSQEFSRILKEVDHIFKDDIQQKQLEKRPAHPQLDTELDMYEGAFMKAANKDKIEETSLFRDDSDRGAAGWLTGVGWDGRQKRKTSGHTESSGENENKSSRTTTHTFRTTRRFDPVSNPDQTLPWLLTSPYSPIYISNPTLPRLAKVDLVDEPMVPFQILSPFFAERFQHPVAEELAKKLSWADAFEDLISLEQTGKLVDRDQATKKTPHTWIHDMVARGSLGPAWGFDDQHRLVKRDLTKSIDTWPSADAVQNAIERAKGMQPNEPISVKDSEERQDVELSSPVQHVVETGLPVGWERREGANGRPYYVDHNTRTTTWDCPSPAQGPVPSVENEVVPFRSSDGSGDISSSGTSWSSTSASSWTMATDDSADSVVSTLTTTETRTLSDGSVETRRVLKKRFADGREESNETVETKTALASSTKPKQLAESVHNDSKILIQVAEAQADKQTQTPAQPQDPPRKGGWFWN